MRVWLVNPFDPLPGDPEQEGRYGTLARMLMDSGHEVTWWTSQFSHRFKKPVDRQVIESTCSQLGLKVNFIPAPPYTKNVSLARLWNHFLLARRFSRLAPDYPDHPEVIVASIPPPMLASNAGQFAKQIGAKYIVDIQDLWPETFYRLAPGKIRRIMQFILYPWLRAARRTYRIADAIVGVADAYVQHAINSRSNDAISQTIPLGINLNSFDRAIRKGVSRRFTKPMNQTWLIYSGSLNRSYDCITILQAFAKIPPVQREKLQLFITGKGELQDTLLEIVARKRLHNVHLTGFIDFNIWAYLISQCDIGFNACLPEAMIYLPNKLFYYLAAGLAVLNTIPGQCSQIIRDGNCGIDYIAGDPDDCSRAILQCLSDTERLRQMQLSARQLAERAFNRKILYRRYVDLITHCARRTM